MDSNIWHKLSDKPPSDGEYETWVQPHSSVKGWRLFNYWHHSAGWAHNDGAVTHWRYLLPPPGAGVGQGVGVEELVQQAESILDGLDRYCGKDGGEPYEGDDCPHEFIGLEKIRRFRQLLARSGGNGGGQ